MFDKLKKHFTFKKAKKLLLKSVFIFFWLFLISPSAGNIANATNDTQSSIQTENLIEMNTLLELIGNISYIIVWPLVSLAGIAMDNQMVYGSFMYLDAPLRKLRNLVKNLANFALGFIFLAWVLGYVLSPWGLWKVKAFKNAFKNPTDLIKKTLIAGVLVQMSWFIMMVLVDLSTILTYSVWALPSSIISQVGSGASSKILSTNIILNMGDAQKRWSQDQNETIIDYYTLGWVNNNGGMNIAPCLVVKRTDKESYIVGRKYDKLIWSNGKEIPMNDGYCAYYSSLFSYTPFSVDSEPQGNKGATYSNQMDLIKNKLPSMDSKEIQKLREAGMIIKLWSASQTGIVEQNVEIWSLKFVPHTDRKLRPGPQEELWTPKVWPITNKQVHFCSAPKNCSYQYQFPYSEYGLDSKQIIEKAKSRTGPFVTLYSSLMSYSNSVDLTSHGLGQKFLTQALNVWLAILLVLPLAALVVVLLWRVIVLWIVIAISPFLVLKEAFWEMFGDIGDKMDFFNVGEILKLLFAPVLVAFAVGISLVFLSALKETLPASWIVESWKEGQYREVFKNVTWMGISPLEWGWQELDLLWMIKIKAEMALINFSWLILMIFGMALTWFLLFWAIKSTKLWSEIWGKLKTFGESILATTPIIPTASGGIWFGSLINKPGEIISNYNNELATQRNNQLKGLLDPTSAEGIKNAAENYANGELAEFDYVSNGVDNNIKELDTYYDSVSKISWRYEENSPEGIAAKEKLKVIGKKYEDLIDSGKTFQEKLWIFSRETTKKFLNNNTIQDKYLNLLWEASTLQDKLSVLGSAPVWNQRINKELVQKQYEGLYNSVNTIQEKITILNSNATLMPAIDEELVAGYYTSLIKEPKITVDEALAILNSENAKKVRLKNQKLYTLLPKTIREWIVEDEKDGKFSGKYKKKGENSQDQQPPEQPQEQQ